MAQISINDLNILKASEVIELGIEFAEDVCYSGDYGEQVFNKPKEEGGTPISGLLYEKYSNDKLAYYSAYENGILHGVTVEFYRSGKVREYKLMEKGVVTGKSFSWFESGKVKSIAESKFGFKIHYQEWDEDGTLMKIKQEPTSFEKEMISKYNLEA